MMAVARRKGITLKTTHKFLNVLFSEDVHAKRIYSLANATLGVISSASLAVNTIGQALALARGKLTKHAIKQVDRMLSRGDVQRCQKKAPAIRPGLEPVPGCAGGCGGRAPAALSTSGNRIGSLCPGKKNSG